MKKYLLVFALLFISCDTDQLPQEPLTSFDAVATQDVKLWTNGEVPFMLTERTYESSEETKALYRAAINKIESKTDIRFIEVEDKNGSLQLIQSIDAEEEFGYAELGNQTYGDYGWRNQYVAVKNGSKMELVLRVLAYSLGQRSAETETIDYEYLNTIY
jgi:hypothetical protein